MATSVTYPSSPCFAFNPLFIEIVSEERTAEITATCQLKTRRLTAYISNGKTRVYISRLLQMFFDDIPNVRSVDVTIRVDGSFERTLSCVWGCVGVLDNQIGWGAVTMNEDGRSICRRKTTVFRNFPGCVSVFSQKTGNLIEVLAKAGNVRKQSLITSTNAGVFDIPFESILEEGAERAVITTEIQRGEKNSSFDAVFDFAIQDITKVVYDVLDVEFSDMKNGVYLRWIDNYGFWQYYLFSNGEKSMKSKADGNSIGCDTYINNVNFGGVSRSVSVSSEMTMNIAACSVGRNELYMLKTILTSPYVDYYRGKGKDGDDIWVPVSLEDSTTKFNSKATLQDFEITIKLPDVNAQRL